MYVDTINVFECGIQYVDETVQPFNKGMNGHTSKLLHEINYTEDKI
jgi:hypothetical protein